MPGRNLVQFPIPLTPPQPARYEMRRYNAFQRGQEDFFIPPTERSNSASLLSLSVDFESAMPDAVFRRLPVAELTRLGKIERVKEAFTPSTADGTRWTAEVTAGLSEGVRLRWELTDGFPESDVYVFGYGSLLNPKSIKESLPEFRKLKSTFIPARLRACTESVLFDTRGQSSQHEVDHCQVYPSLLAFGADLI